MFFDLLVLKLKYLKAVRICSLSCFCLSKIVYYALVGISLFYVIVCKVDD
jgi:hypothetical protein